MRNEAKAAAECLDRAFGNVLGAGLSGGVTIAARNAMSFATIAKEVATVAPIIAKMISATATTGNEKADQKTSAKADKGNDADSGDDLEGGNEADGERPNADATRRIKTQKIKMGLGMGPLANLLRIRSQKSVNNFTIYKGLLFTSYNVPKVFFNLQTSLGNVCSFRTVQLFLDRHAENVRQHLLALRKGKCLPDITTPHPLFLYSLSFCLSL
jgi:hypothetical protein